MCDHSHKDALDFPVEGDKLRFEDVRELTLSTFSWLQGEWWPGYGLLSLGSGEVGVEHCGLPSQIAIYAWYGVVCALSVAWISLESTPSWRCCGLPVPGVRVAAGKRGCAFLLCALLIYGVVHAASE